MFFKLNQVLGVNAKNTTMAFNYYNERYRKIFKTTITISSRVEVQYIPDGTSSTDDLKPRTVNAGPVANKVGPKPMLFPKVEPTLNRMEAERTPIYQEHVFPRPLQKPKPDIPLISSTYKAR